MTYIHRGRALRALPGLVLAAVLAAGCNTDDLVAVQDNEQLRPEDVASAATVPALVQGAIRQFVGGYSGFGLDDSYITLDAVITDQFYSGDTFTTRQAADRRSMQPASVGNYSDPAYTRLHQTRFHARRAFAAVGKFSTSATADDDIVTQSFLRALEGYTYVTLSEGWCGAVPFSVLPDEGEIDPSAIEFGPPLSTDQMNEVAVVRFNEALALDADNHFAAVGKGRALLNLGRFAEAGTAVAGVPTTFVYHAEHSSNEGTQNNPVFELQGNGRYGIANLEGATLRPDGLGPLMTGTDAEGLPYRASQDPRIPHHTRPACFTTSIRCWINDNYAGKEADVPIASGVEARLIQAEAQLAAGDPTWIVTLNSLRGANAMPLIRILYPNQVVPNPFEGNTLAPLVDPVTPAARVNLLFAERAYWMFNTGHRLGDMRRLVRDYGRNQSSVFPSGPWWRGGVYGSDVNHPVPFNEENNPEFSRSACVTTEA